MPRLRRRPRARHLALCMLVASAAANAEQAAIGDSPPTTREMEAADSTRTYTPEDFARFAPRNALEMLRQVSGFTIVTGDTGRRGLGQASANVLINGQRFAGKSSDVVTELSRIPSGNVIRIEIVDGATLDVPGLSGQVANVITAAGGLSGTFAWRPQYRPEFDQFRPLNGEISVSGTAGGFDFTASLSNESFLFGRAGPETVFGPGGPILDVREDLVEGGADRPRLSGSLSRSFGDGSLMNLNGSLGFDRFEAVEISLRRGPDRPDRERRVIQEREELSYEFGGDYELGVGGGRLKVIGLRRFENDASEQLLIVSFAEGQPDSGGRFTRLADETETILRGEYQWNAGGADWQLSAEGALNALDIENGLFRLTPDGDFVPVPLPGSIATVEERRGEVSVSFGRALADSLALQSSVGGEYSILEQSGPAGLRRQFFRPKGFVSLAWQPSPALDLSARLSRVVGQLNFSDFVASTNLGGGTTDVGNVELVPPQSWDAEVRSTRSLAEWGTATVRAYARLISDIVDIIPIGETGQAPGNIESATVFGLQWTSTFNFDPIGWRGARLNLDFQLQESALDDILTGERRPISDDLDHRIEARLRYDQPGTAWAYGASFEQVSRAARFRLDQVLQITDTPGDLGLFVENKNVMGLTLRAAVDNLLDSTERLERISFEDRRPGPVLFTELRERTSGPVFTISVSGTI